MKVIYLLSGLGADNRVFEFLDLTAFQVRFIDWTTPGVNESIEDYAKRLCTQITTHKPSLIGVSFGGIVATEIAKHIECEKVILISSAETKNDIPVYFRLIGMMRIHKLIPASFFKYVNSLTYWAFDTQSIAERAMLKEIIQTTDTKFLSWAIDQIVSWKKNSTIPDHIKIHGTADRILPSKKANYWIEGGGHFMIVSKANLISRILQKILS
jgi:pimeloyl-ACP methyl ester carboxylesterase